MENSFEVLKTDTIDLMEVHNLRGTEAILRNPFCLWPRTVGWP